MSSWSFLWWLIPLVPALIALGAWLHHVWSARQERERKRIPKHWSLSTRSITNSEEALVWHWLSRAFYDHHVMIKMPVTRFTLPQDRDQSMEWYRLLGGVYCTFTVCNADGLVVGCIDVPGRTDIPRSTRMLKHSLLTQCGLPYWVVRSGSLPTITEVRGEFLGETPTAQTVKEREVEERAIIAAQQHLRSALTRQRSSRVHEHSPISSWPSSNGLSDSRTSNLGSQWQENSFFMPQDSRKGDLL